MQGKFANIFCALTTRSWKLHDFDSQIIDVPISNDFFKNKLRNKSVRGSGTLHVSSIEYQP